MSVCHKVQKPPLLDPPQINFVRVGQHKFTNISVSDPVGVNPVRFVSRAASGSPTEHLAIDPIHHLMTVHTKRMRQSARGVSFEVLLDPHPPNLKAYRV